MTGSTSAENTILSGLTKKDIISFGETFLPSLTDQQQQLIRDIFQEKTKILQYPGKQKATSLLESVFSLAFDPGLKRSGVYVFTRQAFITRLKNKVGFKQIDNGFTTDSAFAVFKFDLVGIGGMDEKKGDEKIRALASSLSSFFSRTIELTDEKEGKFTIQPSDIIFGRYGGDEFVVGLVNKDEKVRRLFAEYLKNVMVAKPIKDNKGEEVKLKDDKIDSFDFLSGSDDDKKNFLQYLALGQVLTKEEINKVKQYSLNFQPKTIEIPESIEDLKNKILELTETHSEFRFAFRIAEHLDRLAKDINFSRTRRLYEFIANNVFDPLLGRITIGRGDLLSHLDRGEFKKAFAFELKVKETNDRISYGYSDKMIVEFWEEMKRVFGEEKINKFKIGRFGGLIVVFSADENFGLTADQIKQLSEIEVDRLTHFVGFAEIDLSTQEEPAKKARQIYESASPDWLEKVLSYYNQNQEAKQRFLGFLENPRTRPEDPKDMDYIHAIHASYFDPKGRLEKRKKQVEEVAKRDAELAEICKKLLEKI